MAAATKTSAKAAPAAKTVAARPKAYRGAEQRFHKARRASILLKHVSDPTRLQVILILSEGERHVGALCAQLSQSQPAVSHHLALLRHGGIIAPRRQGKNNFYSLTETGVRPRPRRQEPDRLIASGSADARPVIRRKGYYAGRHRLDSARRTAGGAGPGREPVPARLPFGPSPPRLGHSRQEPLAHHGVHREHRFAMPDQRRRGRLSPGR